MNWYCFSAAPQMQAAPRSACRRDAAPAAPLSSVLQRGENLDQLCSMSASLSSQSSSFYKTVREFPSVKVDKTRRKLFLLNSSLRRFGKNLRQKPYPYNKNLLKMHVLFFCNVWRNQLASLYINLLGSDSFRFLEKTKSSRQQFLSHEPPLPTMCYSGFSSLLVYVTVYRH